MKILLYRRCSVCLLATIAVIITSSKANYVTYLFGVESIFVIIFVYFSGGEIGISS